MKFMVGAMLILIAEAKVVNVYNTGVLVSNKK